MTRWTASDLVIDVPYQRVERDGREIPLSPLSFRLLLALVEAAPEVVSIDQLMDRAWNGVIVGPDTVTQRIKLLRTALGDDYQHPRYIQSVRGRGYRLLVPVTPLDSGTAAAHPAAAPPPLHPRGAEGLIRSRKARVLLAAALTVPALLAVTLLLLRQWPPAFDADVPIGVAVLPFANLSPDPDNDYVALGVSEEITSLLTRFPQLRVTAPTSSRQLRDSALSIGEMARQLRVDYVVIGSLRRDGERVRITVQLVRGEDDARVWSESYDFGLGDIFTTQDEIADAVADRFRLGPGTLSEPMDPEAYLLFLRAMYLTQRASPEGFEAALAIYHQALDRAPDYAAAWDGIARVRQQQGLLDLATPEAFAQAREAATRALALDPGFGLAHSRLGALAMIEGDLATAARHIQRGLELDPGNRYTLGNAAMLLRNIGRLEQALAFSAAADEMDQLNPRTNLASGYDKLAAGHLDAALDHIRATLLLSPGFPTASYYLGIALLLRGEPGAALEAMAAETVEVERQMGLAMARHALGQTAESDAALGALLALHQQGRARSYDVARVLAWRRQDEDALTWLEQAAGERPLDPDLQPILVEPLLRDLHDEERWKLLMGRLGRSEVQLASIPFDARLPGNTGQ